MEDCSIIGQSSSVLRLKENTRKSVHMTLYNVVTVNLQDIIVMFNITRRKTTYHNAAGQRDDKGISSFNEKSSMHNNII